MKVKLDARIQHDIVQQCKADLVYYNSHVTISRLRMSGQLGGWAIAMRLSKGSYTYLCRYNRPCFAFTDFVQEPFTPFLNMKINCPYTRTFSESVNFFFFWKQQQQKIMYCNSSLIYRRSFHVNTRGKSSCHFQ